MIPFIIARFFRALVVLFLTVTFVFIILRVSGDPAQQMLGDLATPESIQIFRANWGLDKSIVEQFVIYVGNALHGDFGVSSSDGRLV
ncbi:MAG: ABC transporter permease, partial [Devosia sp.]